MVRCSWFHKRTSIRPSTLFTNPPNRHWCCLSHPPSCCRVVSSGRSSTTSRDSPAAIRWPSYLSTLASRLPVRRRCLSNSRDRPQLGQLGSLVRSAAERAAVEAAWAAKASAAALGSNIDPPIVTDRVQLHAGSMSSAGSEGESGDFSVAAKATPGVDGRLVKEEEEEEQEQEEGHEERATPGERKFGDMAKALQRHSVWTAASGHPYHAER
ncbi:expressed unknown protein [Ectocarpus siliculosus]|uniref:Uncharacterized protein n=1 Tax=Ectocarpus siliculosus TaxID=2880 RepID=D7G986_ECTSI|nr:expressed unknown protein [Ectocarpus siliculosus]|eukprot:CBJ28213.1 expressed unknown protein [Ectocarpus siliculosus]